MKITDDVLQVLSGLKVAGSRVTIEQQLERKLYTKVNEVLEAMGGKWNRSAKAHVFPDGEDVLARLDGVIMHGEITTDRDMGYFPTPSPLAQKLVELADVQPGMHVLEPSAGEGAIVQALLGRRPHTIVAVEIDKGRSLKLARLMAKPNNHAGVLVLDTGDFLRWQHLPDFDRVVMNPPFIDHLEHVRRAFGMLKIGGVLVTVLPSGVKFRQDKKHTDFRAWAALSAECAWLDNDEHAFRPSGTDVRTVTLRMKKVIR